MQADIERVLFDEPAIHKRLDQMAVPNHGRLPREFTVDRNCNRQPGIPLRGDRAL
jgi:hypothetical protein